MTWFKKKIEKPEYNFSDHEILYLEKDRSEYSWVGSMMMPFSNAQFELTIEVENKSEPSKKQINSIKNLRDNWENIGIRLFAFMSNCYQDTKWEKDKEELKNMYHLSAVELKLNETELWIVLEPEIHLSSIFNFFPRFTLKNNEIIWSNI